MPPFSPQNYPKTTNWMGLIKITFSINIKKPSGAFIPAMVVNIF